jgi:hypothetical protein
LLNDNPALTKNLEKLSFNLEQISTLIKRYNDSKSNDKTVLYNYKVKSIVKHFIEGSFVLPIPPKNIEISHRKGYSFGYFIDFQKPDISRKLSSKIGINYLYLRYDYPDAEKINGIWYPADITRVEHYIRIPFQAQYNFSDFSAKSCFFLNAGLTAEISTTSEFENYKATPNISIGTGAYLGKFKMGISSDGFLLDDHKNVNFSLAFRIK